MTKPETSELRDSAPLRETVFSASATVIQRMSARLKVIPLRLMVLSLLAFFASVTALPACSIPVFRFALERWSPDLFEVSVFYRGALNDSDQKRLNQLEDWAVHNGGNVNLEVVRCNLDEQVPEDLLALWKSLKDASLPTIVVRTPRKSSGQQIVWQGRLSDPFLDDLATSPARHEITRRLLSGDSIVWLLVRGTDEEIAARARQTLDSAIAQISDEIELPPGVGSPGSELRTRIPLHLRFTVLEISADSRVEKVLVRLLHGSLRKSARSTESYVVPIFGRGRVLDVLPARELESESIGDLTRYLCGACSCQVKQQNPGFDLLCAMNWEGRLFDENVDSAQIASTESVQLVTESTGDSEPVVIAIPPGQSSRVSKSLPESSARFPTNGHRYLLVALSTLALMASWIVVAK